MFGSGTSPVDFLKLFWFSAASGRASVLVELQKDPFSRLGKPVDWYVAASLEVASETLGYEIPMFWMWPSRCAPQSEALSLLKCRCLHD